jgi:AmmeMemoRadiSam system protein A
MTEPLTEAEKRILLQLAREALERGVNRQSLPRLDQTNLTPALRAQGASFITLTKHGQLRGCVGALEPYQPLVDDVREHAIAAALQDYRFPPVQPNELPKIEIEVSRLTIPTPLDYTSSEDLLARLHPGLDGVLLRDGSRRATFLPQVWEQIPDKVEFLSQLCAKMGAARDLWRRKHLEVLIYQVEEFHE